ncbi:MAG: hypothetical protein MUF80_11955, partial [Burkholderiales bacterium]|nr:hypothetical protein [Burkholderiales bacterium]
MARMAVTVLALVLAAAPAFADVTVKYTMSGKGMMGMAGTVNSTTMIKGNKMRSEAMVGNTQSVSIID